MKSIALVHALGVVAALASFALVMAVNHPREGVEDTSRVNSSVQPPTADRLKSVLQQVEEAVAADNAFLQCAVGLLAKKTLEEWWPTEASLQQQPLLRNALLTHGIGGGYDDWPLSELDLDLDGHVVDAQSAKLLSRLTFAGGEDILNRVISVMSLESASRWLASAFVRASENHLPELIAIYDKLFAGNPAHAREVIWLMLLTPEGLDRLFQNEDAVALVAKYFGTSNHKDLFTVTMGDGDSSAIDIAAYLESNATKSEKADMIRKWVQHLPLAKLIGEASSLVSLYDEQPLYQKFCAGKIIERLASSDVGYALETADELEDQFSIKVSRQTILRLLMDVDPWEASRRIAEMPPGDARDMLIGPLIQSGKLSIEEREAWISAIHNPNKRSQYEEYQSAYLESLSQ